MTLASKAGTIPLLAALALTLAAAASSFADDEIQFIKHESQEAGYSINLPLDWDLKTNLKDWDCVAFAPKAPMAANDYLENAAVALIDDKDGKGPSPAAGALVASLKAKSPAFSLISQKELKVSGCDALRLEYVYESDSVKVRAVTLFISKGQRILAATLSGDPKRFFARKSVFDKIEASFSPL